MVAWPCSHLQLVRVINRDITHSHQLLLLLQPIWLLRGCNLWRGWSGAAVIKPTSHEADEAHLCWGGQQAQATGVCPANTQPSIPCKPHREGTCFPFLPDRLLLDTSQFTPLRILPRPPHPNPRGSQDARGAVLQLCHGLMLVDLCPLQRRATAWARRTHLTASPPLRSTMSSKPCQLHKGFSPPWSPSEQSSTTGHRNLHPTSLQELPPRCHRASCFLPSL